MTEKWAICIPLPKLGFVRREEIVSFPDSSLREFVIMSESKDDLTRYLTTLRGHIEQAIFHSQGPMDTPIDVP